MPENNDYSCKVCGKHFSEEDDYKNHGERDHPEVNEAYPDLFNKKEEPREEKEAEEFDWSEVPEDEWDDVVLRKVNGDKEEEEPAEEIDQQIDKPVQSHDDWVKELEGLKDEIATEEEKCAICNGEHPTSEHPVLEEGGAGSGPQEGSKPALLPEQVARAGDPHYNPFKATPPSERLQTDPALSRMTEDAPDESASSTPYTEDAWQDKLVWNSETNHYEEEKKEGEEQEEDDGSVEKPQYEFDRSHDKEEGEEEGGADDPLAKVADLAENYKYLSRDRRASLFESLKFTQGDSAILAGLEWNELTRPVKVEASEAYIKEQEEEEPKEEADEEEEEENKAYENLYNLEKYHSSPDYKKKSLTCNRCNEAFYNTNDRNVHYNDVHAQEQDYKLPETCPYCNIEINEPDNLDWHMQEEHGAHVPSQYTQTGLQGAMADTDFDSLESHKKANEVEHDKCPQCNFETSWKEGDSLQKTDAEREMSSHIKDKHGGESYASEGRSEDLKREIKEKEDFIRLASLENPMNMGEFENELVDLKDELAMVGANEEEEDLVIDTDEDLYALHKGLMDKPIEGEEQEEEKTPLDYLVDGEEQEEEGWGSPEETAKDIYDLGHPEEAEEEDVELVPDKGEFLNMMRDTQAPPEKEAEEQEVETGWLDPDTGELVQERPKKLHTIDSVRRLEGEEEDDDEYECEDCGKTFNDPANLQEHQYSNWHGEYKDDYEGQSEPRNVMGGY